MRKGEPLIGISAKETTESSQSKWKFMKLCDVKLPSDFSLEPSVKSTMGAFSDERGDLQSPMFWRAWGQNRIYQLSVAMITVRNKQPPDLKM